MRHLLTKTWLSILLSPVSSLYSSILYLRRKLMFINQYHAPVCIVSIGNIVSGGSGKTPTTISIARLLAAAGYKVAVSHRGYQGAYESIPTVISDIHGVYDLASQAGDEANLIAIKLPGIPVVVGKNRKAAIKLLLQNNPKLQIIVLDDSFQHLKVFHDVDIITFSSDIGIGNGYVLPAGYLREPLMAIQQSHIAVINRKDPMSKIKSLENCILRYTRQVFEANMHVDSYYNCEGQTVALEDIRELPLILISGIAFPASFMQTAVQDGLKIYKSYQFSDHYAFDDEKQIRHICDFCKTHGIKYILTTEKDFVKLRKFECIHPMLVVCAVSYKMEKPNEFEELLLKRIALSIKTI